jgi:UDP-hydrolysing UDP-N-acetyl-D-glucosamine 2-epimerase
LRIAAVTGGRADWGLLSFPLSTLKVDDAFELSLIVTGQHLAPGEKRSLTEIVADGFTATEAVDIGLGPDNAQSIGHSFGLAVAKISEALARLKPDLMLILGDRYEIFAAAIAALFHRIPVVHLCGGDVTEGAMDDGMRHAITKLSHIHFVTNMAARDRVIQLGEDPARVFCVGSPGLDRIRLTPVLSRDEFFKSVGLMPRQRNLLVTYHPVTLAADPFKEVREMLAALVSLGPDVGILLTGSNADINARGIDALIGSFIADRQNAVRHRTLGAQCYYSAMTHLDVMVGNSSSGLYEAPSFSLPTVNIGDRQKGRIRAHSVIDCVGERNAIKMAITEAFAFGRKQVENPYGDGFTCTRILAALKALGSPETLVQKRFLNI